jgi:hypothetical protein
VPGISDSNRDREEWCVLFSVFKGESDLESDFFFVSERESDFFFIFFAIYFVLTDEGKISYFLSSRDFVSCKLRQSTFL